MVSVAKRQGLKFPATREIIAGMEPYIDEPIEMIDRGLEILESYHERGVELRMKHLEAMCAAYLMATDIDPTEVVLVEEQSGILSEGIQIRWYYTRKDDIDDNIIHDTEAV